MKTAERALRAVVLAGALIGVAANPAQVQFAAALQSYPNKPIRVIVASGTGGGLDFVARLIGSKLGESLGQSVIVDNRALAIATAMRARVAPDLPAMIKAGVPGFVVTQWHGLLAPRGTPRTVIDRLHREGRQGSPAPRRGVAALCRWYGRGGQHARPVRRASQVRTRHLVQSREADRAARRLSRAYPQYLPSVPA